MNPAEIDSTRSQAQAEIDACSDVAALERIERKYLGKGGVLAAWLASIPGLPPAERPLVGQAVNRLKKELTTLVAARAASLEKTAAERDASSGTFDPTLPPARPE